MDASTVESPLGNLSKVTLLAADGQPLGTIEGVVIETAARRVRYYAVRSSGWLGRRHYLLRADQLAQIDLHRKAIRLRFDSDLAAVQGVDAALLRKVSDDDLFRTTLPSHAA
jgi:PRC-barrel domain